MKRAALALVAYFVVCASIAQTPDSLDRDSIVQADNLRSQRAAVSSAINASTADSQSNLASDLKITQRIHNSVMADKGLSTYAHNVKIISVHGAVTLNGVVRTEHEKQIVETKAQAIAGRDKVTSDLTIAPKT